VVVELADLLLPTRAEYEVGPAVLVAAVP
jgi:hypothetical protein